MMKTNLLEMAADHPPPFHSYKLTRLQEWEDALPFFSKDHTAKNEAVDLSRIVGHDQGYDKMTWGYMLSGLKRIERNQKYLERDPEYYLRGTGYEGWSFICVDGAYFISTGKHRTTIARYLAYYNPEHFPDNKITGVEVHYRSADKKAMDLFEEIKEQLKTQTFDHLEYGFGKDWRTFESYFFLCNPLVSESECLRFEKTELDRALQVLENRSLAARLFGNHESKYLLRKAGLF